MRTISVGVIGMGWMGTVHSRAYLAAADRYYDQGVRARLVICADNDVARSRQAQARLGFEQSSADWQDVVNHPEVEIVNIASPNFLHREMALAAIAAGKHVFVEKPAGRTPEETAEIYRAAAAGGVKSFVGLNYRWAPLVQFARQLIEAGQLGEITHYRGRFFAMYASDPLSRLNWRFQHDKSGSGILADVMPHVVDMAHYLAGPIVRVVSGRHIFIKERPLPAPDPGTHFDRGRPDDPHGAVTNEDTVSALVEFANGARGTLEVCRVIKGPKAEMAFEIYGRNGALKWNLEAMNEMEVYLPDENKGHEGFVRLLAGPDHPDHARFNPGPGVGLGYEDLKTIEAANFLQVVAADEQRPPGLAEAYAYAKVMAAMMRSWNSSAWETVTDL